METVTLDIPKGLEPVAEDLKLRIAQVWHVMCGSAFMGDIEGLITIQDTCMNIAESNINYIKNQSAWKPHKKDKDSML